jgi:hypothetical protein
LRIRLPWAAGPEKVQMTRIITYRVLLREGEDGTDYTLERPVSKLVPPTVHGGPYLTQEGDAFLVDEVSEMASSSAAGTAALEGKSRADRPQGTRSNRRGM